MDTTSSKKRMFKRFFSLLKWWKRRKFQYLAHVETKVEYILRDSRAETLKDAKSKESRADSDASPSPKSSFVSPSELYFNARKQVTPRRSYSFDRPRTVDSFQDSIESMDSIMDSYWDPDEETSQATELATNVQRHDEFLLEHLNFLSVQTQPQEVELMYNI